MKKDMETVTRGKRARERATDRERKKELRNKRGNGLYGEGMSERKRGRASLGESGSETVSSLRDVSDIFQRCLRHLSEMSPSKSPNYYY